MREAIRIVAALIRDEAGRVLLVRKRGTAAFMQPGGKRDPGEDDVAAPARGGDGGVRARGPAAFVEPGGRRDPGEDDVAALARELDEELGCRVVTGSARPLGEF